MDLRLVQQELIMIIYLVIKKGIFGPEVIEAWTSRTKAEESARALGTNEEQTKRGRIQPIILKQEDPS